MSEEWDKVKEDWKSFDEYDLKHIWAAGDTLQAETKVLKYENKQLIDRNKYLEGLTDGDVKLITKLQVENEKLKHTIATGYCGECEVLKEENKQLRRDTKDLAELGSDDLKKRVAYQKENEVLKIVTAKLFNKLADEQQKLEAIRCVVNDPPTYSIPFLGNPAPEVQEYIKRMDTWYCKLLNTAQNTEAKQT